MPLNERPTFNIDAARETLLVQGYLVIENALAAEDLAYCRRRFDELMAQEREHPIHPTDGEAMEGDDEIAAYYKRSYTVSDAELERLMARMRHTRSQNLNTPWPVPIQEVPKSFLHLPTMFDHDKSQRVWNLVNKAPDLGRLLEHPTVLPIVRGILGQDCNVHDFEATSIGPRTGGGAWHVDAPLGQLPEPLPDFPLMVQNVWILDDFTEHNGATRVVPRSHLLRKSPPWGGGVREDELILTAPAGSVAIWLSNTWHRSGPNETDKPRRAILCNYNRSWLRTFTDFTTTMSPEVAAGLSDNLRYLLGFSAKAPEVR